MLAGRSASLSERSEAKLQALRQYPSVCNFVLVSGVSFGILSSADESVRQIYSRS